MSDDNFFNSSINGANGFASSLIDTSGVLPAGTSLGSAPTVAVVATLPPATIGAGVVVNLVVDDITAGLTVVVDATVPDTVNGGAGPVLGAVRLYTFVSDGVSNWVYTA